MVFCKFEMAEICHARGKSEGNANLKAKKWRERQTFKGTHNTMRCNANPLHFSYIFIPTNLHFLHIYFGIIKKPRKTNGLEAIVNL